MFRECINRRNDYENYENQVTNGENSSIFQFKKLAKITKARVNLANHNHFVLHDFLQNFSCVMRNINITKSNGKTKS
eukprot:UN01147